MCIKAGKNEFASVKALMDMTLNSLIADTFDVDIDELNNTLDLRKDLGMKQAEAMALRDKISDYFDGLDVDMKQMETIADLHKLLADSEFQNISEQP